MDGDWNNLFTVDEILGGLPARRASSLLYAIEGHTGYLVSRARRALAPDISGRSAEQKEQAFLAALSSGATLPIKPTVQNLERYAQGWASLVPDDPSVRASLARLIGEKYRLPREHTPRIQRALGTSTPEVIARFQKLHAEPVDTIFVSSVSVAERLKWLQSRIADKLENLPPFWTAFALTLTETVGAGVLALPIAFATIGAAGGILLLLLLGLVNILTMGAIAEAVSRSGDVRYGHAYFGRLVQEFLGKPGLLLLLPSMLLLYITILFAYAIGFSATLSEAIGFHPVIWVALLLTVILVFVRRDSLNATITSALVIGTCSIGLIIGLILLSSPHIDATNLRHSEFPLIGGHPFDGAVLELIFGVVLLAFFGHTATANCAAVVLERERSGKALIQGSTAAMLVAALLYAVWIFAVNGSVPPEQLNGFPGTALTPLADVAGPGISAAGTLFVVLSMGMASIHISWGTIRTMTEWLPARSPVPGVGNTLAQSQGSAFSSAPIRQAIGRAPVVMVFLLAALLILFDKESFTEPFGLVGVLTIPIVSGVFAMLLLKAGRRKGDCLVGYDWNFLGHPIVVALLIGFFLTALFAHGLVIWSAPAPRAAAIAIGCVLILFIVITQRSGEFLPRAVAQIRYEAEAESHPVVELMVAGKQATGAVSFGNGHWSPVPRSPETIDGLSPRGARPADIIEITLDASPAHELKVWVHQLTADGVSRAVPAILTHNGEASIDLEPLGGKIVLNINGNAQALRIVAKPGE